MGAVERWQVRGLWAVVLTMVMGALAACGGGADDDADAGGSGGAGGSAEDDFTAVLPDDEMMALSADGDAEGSALGQEQGLGENGLHELSVNARQRLHDLLTNSHRLVRSIAESGPGTEVRLDNKDCKVWEFDGAIGTTPNEAHWNLTVCEQSAKTFRFSLRGRPTTSTEDADYLPVLAGQGKVLAKADGRRRGAGKLGWNFDNWATLSGADTAGRMGLGYRVAGRARQMHLALDGVRGAGETDTHTGIFRFRRIVGVGGKFSFRALADVVAPGTDRPFAPGQDGIDEKVHSVLAWNRGRAARSLSRICDGTMGDGNCLRLAQCWSGEGAQTSSSDASDAAEPIEWSRTECPEVPFEPEEPMDEPLPPAGDDAGAPAAEEPEPIDGE